MTKRGELYWADLGIPEGSEQGFRRPVLIIQNNIGNDFGPTTIVAAVTSRIPPKVYPHVVIVQPRESGLRERSAILLNQVRTLDQSRLEERCGKLTPNRMRDVDEALRVSLGLE